MCPKTILNLCKKMSIYVLPNHLIWIWCVFSIILEEMQQHEDAWPFLTPVNTKQFPTYKKVIKKPMDMATMQNKLDAGQ